MNLTRHFKGNVVYIVTFLLSIVVGFHAPSFWNAGKRAPISTVETGSDVLGARESKSNFARRLPLDQLRSRLSEELSINSSRLRTALLVEFVVEGANNMGVDKVFEEMSSVLSSAVHTAPERSFLLELAVLSVVREKRLRTEDLTGLLRNVAHRDVDAILSAAAFTALPDDIGTIYSRLSKLFNPSITGKARYSALLRASVTAATSVNPSELSKFADAILKSTSENYDVEIAIAISKYDIGTAFSFGLLRSKGNGRALAKFVSAMLLTNDEFSELVQRVPFESIDEFLGYYSAELGGEQIAYLFSRLPPDSFTAGQRTGVFRMLLKSDENTIATWLSGISPPEKAHLVNQCFRTMMDDMRKGGLRSPASGMWNQLFKVAVTIEDSDREMVAALFSGNAHSIPSELALKIIPTLPIDKQSEVAKDFYVKQMIESIRDKGADFSLSMDSIPREIRASATEALGQRIAYLPSVADKILAGESDPFLQQAIRVGRVVSGQASLNEQKEWIEAQLTIPTQNPSLPRVADIYLENLAQSNPEEIPNALAIMPENSLKERAIQKLSKTWASADPVSASNWITSLPAGRSRDLAMVELVVVATDDPERAIENGAGIDDSKLRSEALSNLANSYKDRDISSFLHLINSSKLNEVDKNSIIRIFNK